MQNEKNYEFIIFNISGSLVLDFIRKKERMKGNFYIVLERAAIVINLMTAV